MREADMQAYQLYAQVTYILLGMFCTVLLYGLEQRGQTVDYTALIPSWPACVQAFVQNKDSAVDAQHFYNAAMAAFHMGLKLV